LNEMSDFMVKQKIGKCSPPTWRYYRSYSHVGAEETTIYLKTGDILTTDLNLRSGTSWIQWDTLHQCKVIF
jgi:hypothetical protein